MLLVQIIFKKPFKCSINKKNWKGKLKKYERDVVQEMKKSKYKAWSRYE